MCVLMPSIVFLETLGRGCCQRFGMRVDGKCHYGACFIHVFAETLRHFRIPFLMTID